MPLHQAITTSSSQHLQDIEKALEIQERTAKVRKLELENEKLELELIIIQNRIYNTQDLS
jgi:hypothetical protein